MAWYLGQESKFLPDSTGKQRLMRLYYLAPQQRTGGALLPQHLWDTWMLIHRAVPAESFRHLSEYWTLHITEEHCQEKYQQILISRQYETQELHPYQFVYLFKTHSHLSQAHIPSDVLSSQVLLRSFFLHLPSAAVPRSPHQAWFA